MKQLSVSPRKPKTKKLKTSRSVLAPIFQLSKASALGPKAHEYHAKPEGKKRVYSFNDFLFFVLIFSLAVRVSQEGPERKGRIGCRGVQA